VTCPQEGGGKLRSVGRQGLAICGFALFVLSSIALFSWEAVRDDEAGRLALADLKPAMSALVVVGNWWLENALLKFTLVGAALAAALGMLAVVAAIINSCALPLRQA